MKIGLTGGIGSGKSLVASLFEDYGFFTIDLDILSRQASLPAQDSYKDIVKHFGNTILDSNGYINRKLLGKIVFNDKEKLALLEKIIHPTIMNLEEKERRKIRSKNKKPLIITHGALLIEGGFYREYKPLIVISANKNICINRVRSRDKHNIEYIKKIINSQLSNQERIKYGNIIIENNSSVEELKKEVERVVTFITQIYYSINHS